MPSKRRTTRTAQLQPQPAPQSDYDTDTANVTDAPPAQIAPPPKRTNTELNLMVLQRYVSDITHIVAIAPFVVIYTFSPETQQWEKCGIEGTLFICQLTGGRYNVVVLNRKSLENFVEELTGPDDIEITTEYVILQIIGEDDIPQIFGLWIFSEPEHHPSTRDVIVQTIQSCANQAQIAREIAQAEDDTMNGDDDDYSYNTKGAAQVGDQQYDTMEQPQVESVGKQIDLLSLFNKSPAQTNQTSTGQEQVASQPALQPHYQATRFTSTADTDFFRSSHGPATGQQQQQLQQQRQHAQSAQKSALLDLFKK